MPGTDAGVYGSLHPGILSLGPSAGEGSLCGISGPCGSGSDLHLKVRVATRLCHVMRVTCPWSTTL